MLVPREAIALVATADGYEQLRVDNVLAPERPTVDFRLKEGVTVSVRVIGGDTKQPLAGAKVASGIPFFNRKEHGETDREGRFIVRGLSRGGTMFMIQAPGYTEKLEQVVLDGDKKDLNLELDPASSIEGRVTDSGGKPVAGAGLFCSEKNAIAYLTVDSTPKTHTDAEGKFRLTGINAKKEYIVNAEAEGFVRGQSKPLLVEPGKEYKGIDIVLTNGGVLSGRVQDTQGKPIVGADLKVQVMAPPAGDLVWIARELQKTKDGSTEADGTFRLTGVRPGKVKLFVSAEKFLRREDLEFDVAEGGAVQNILINMEKGYSIAGRVTDLNGRPVQRAQVYASGAYPTPSYGTTETGPEGYYRIMSLKGGRFTVNVRAPGYETKMKTDVEADDENVDFVIAKNGSISGRVTASGGAVPVERFRVTLNVVGGGPEGGGGGTPTFSKQKYFNSKEGKYTVEDVGQGLYEVVVSSDDHAPKTVPGVQVRQGE
jgi:protocatechuate 3,4-dioxygenase beta subunit